MPDTSVQLPGLPPGACNPGTILHLCAKCNDDSTTWTLFWLQVSAAGAPDKQFVIGTYPLGVYPHGLLPASSPHPAPPPAMPPPGGP